MTLTTEQLKEIMCVYGNTHPCYLAAAECLANREAQPVGYIDPDSLKEYRGQRAGGTWSAVQRTTSGLNMTTPIYTAPPAPAVNSAPDFEAWFNSPEAGLRVVNFHIQHELQLKAWNACRAAMLAQPVSKRYTLPDGWKLVPVEPTTEMINAALAAGAISIRTAYSAMLAAAPEGGNG
ncbi:hypothetical protein ACUNGV_10020 [Serratia sp. IR-2025]